MPITLSRQTYLELKVKFFRRELKMHMKLERQVDGEFRSLEFFDDPKQAPVVRVTIEH